MMDSERPPPAVKSQLAAPESGAGSSSRGEEPVPSVRRIVLKNTLFLTLGQVAGVPLSILMNAMTARYLGPAAIGMMYLGTTFCSFGFLAVDWGQNGALPALVAKDRSRSGRLLGSSLLWRAMTSAVVYLGLSSLCRLLGYDATMQTVLALVFAGYLLGTIAAAPQNVMLGFERADVSAYRGVLEQLIAIALVAPILVLGGDLKLTLIGHAASVAVSVVFVWRFLKPVGVSALAVDVKTIKELLVTGTPFVFLGLVAVLQPYVDALFLARMVSEEVIGWHASARKLIGFMVFPVSALIGALYPTLCRLWGDDPAGFRSTTSGALRGTALMVMPVALGCSLYPDIGIAIYDRDKFAPAETNLRLLAPYLFLMYFTMPLGISILAAGKRRQWALVQAVCVVVSLAIDPLLIPIFQERYGNGGLGVCVAAVLSEIAVLGLALVLVPKGVFDRRFWKSLGLASLAGGVMVGTAFLLRPIVNSFVAAPIAVAAYALAAWKLGAIDPSIAALVRAHLGRKLARFRG